MKRTITLLIATALILGMSQCKKNVETITPSNLGEAVHITVNVDDGGKHIVYPGTGAYVFENDDKLYVGDGKKYLGTLTYGSGAFSGNITEPAEGDYLYFYFLGGIEISPVAATTSYEISIADQSSQLPVLSFGRSTSTYTTSSATYGCTLLNKCGLVKFVPATATPETVKVGGMKTTATIDFANPGISPTETTGKVTLYSESDAAKWAILLVQGEVSTPPVTIAGYNSTITSVPAVTENYYNKDGVSIAMTMLTPPEGAAGGTANARHFSVSGDKHVWFSQGNLQYNKKTGEFSFMEHQYSTVETAGQNVGNNYANQNIVSLFGWGTSGWNNGNYFYQPYNTSNSTSSPYTSSVGYGYGPTDGSTYTYSLTGTYANADWGYNAISNGGNTQNFGWRTLTRDEWVYVFNTRSTTSGVRYAKAKVNDVNGVIILPDDWSTSYYTLSSTNTTNAAFTSNTITLSDWNTKFEANGAVFLPAAGYRDGTSVDGVGSGGYYWSSTAYSASTACSVYFGSSDFAPSGYNGRCYGGSVRLVFACE